MGRNTMYRFRLPVFFLIECLGKNQDCNHYKLVIKTGISKSILCFDCDTSR